MKIKDNTKIFQAFLKMVGINGTSGHVVGKFGDDDGVFYTTQGGFITAKIRYKPREIIKDDGFDDEIVNEVCKS